MPEPCCTVPVTLPPLISRLSCPSPWSTLSITPSRITSASLPAPCSTPPWMLPPSMSMRSLPAPDTTPPVLPAIVPRFTR